MIYALAIAHSHFKALPVYVTKINYTDDPVGGRGTSDDEADKVKVVA